MTNPSYFESVTSELKFRDRFVTEGAKLFSEIPHVAASEWGRDHLFACRVIRRETRHDVLPILSRHESSSDMKLFPEIYEFLRGPDSTYRSQSEHGLVRDSGCGSSLAQIWAAMAMVKGGKDLRIERREESSGDESDNTPDVSAKRIRRNTAQEYYVNSTDIQVGSSSPMAESSHGHSSIGYVDNETHMFLSSPEDETLRLASCVIRHILYYAPPQDSGHLQTVIEFRDAKRRLTGTTASLGRKIVAIDDGGLNRRKVQGDIFAIDKERVAIIEAKAQFQCVENGRPTISDSCLAQMTCEALVARLSDPYGELKKGSAILIHAAQHYMCFLQFDISDQYLSDFESASPSTFIYVTSTNWFDLSSRSGREQVVKNLSCLMCWAM
ncbi:hypothetical protein BDW42DRAFT_159002 [Aspergillus taichungensis]|uniref:Uncharacterized protein n=1 Tax=Aspergillus taichungensis TaxID=482145 RepID=A0A2J5I8F5_9EURO|nr:hypothetical protein BDW42DRAFT_159002 [Aspergillus taichungensis]